MPGPEVCPVAIQKEQQSVICVIYHDYRIKLFDKAGKAYYLDALLNRLKPDGKAYYLDAC